MFIYFEDWSSKAYLLPLMGLPASERLFKVFNTSQEPKTMLKKPNLAVIEADTKPFDEDEIFSYGIRGDYRGDHLETYLKSRNLPFNNRGYESLRALFRFANSTEMMTCQRTMKIKRLDGSWYKEHPFEIIDSHLDRQGDIITLNQTLHIDIFHPLSVANLRHYADIDDPSQIVTIREGRMLRQIERGEVTFEGQRQPRRERL